MSLGMRHVWRTYTNEPGTVVERPFEGQGSCLTPVYIRDTATAFTTYLTRAVAAVDIWVRLSALRLALSGPLHRHVAQWVEIVKH